MVIAVRTITASMNPALSRNLRSDTFVRVVTEQAWLKLYLAIVV